MPVYIFKSVLRHKVTFSLLGAVFLLFSFYLVVGSNVLSSISSSLEEAVAENMSGDLIIAPKGAARIDLITMDGEKKLLALPRWKELLLFLDGRREVRAAAPRLRVRGRMLSELNSAPVILVGVDPRREEGLLAGRHLDEGAWLRGPGETCLYFRHSDYLSAEVGDSLGVTVRTIDGYDHFDSVRLTGTLDYDALDYYAEFAPFAFVDLGFLNGLLQTRENTVGEVLVGLREGGGGASLEAAIRAKFGDAYAFVQPGQSSKLVAAVSRLTLFCLLFVAAVLLAMVFASSAFLVAATIESRRQEIGVYQAIGIADARIGLLFAGELLVVISIAAAIGAAAGLWLLANPLREGIRATILPLHLIFGRDLLLIRADWRSAFPVLAVLVFVFAGNALFAVRSLGRMQTVDLLRDA